MTRRSYPRRDVLELLSERYGPTAGLIGEVVAKPPPIPPKAVARPVTATSEADAAAHRAQLLAAIPLGTGPFGRAQKRREPGSLPQSRAAVPSSDKTTTVDEGGRVSVRDHVTVREASDKTGEAGR